MSEEINKKITQSFTGEFVELFIFDTTVINPSGELMYLTSSKYADTTVKFMGNDYFPIPMSVSNVTMKGNAAVTRPKLKISNIHKMFSIVINSYGDLTGTKITRMRTWAEFLDDGANPDPGARLPDQEWFILKVDSVSPTEVVFTLGSKLDRPNSKIPQRQVLKDKGFPAVASRGTRRLV